MRGLTQLLMVLASCAQFLFFFFSPCPVLLIRSIKLSELSSPTGSSKIMRPLSPPKSSPNSTFMSLSPQMINHTPQNLPKFIFPQLNQVLNQIALHMHLKKVRNFRNFVFSCSTIRYKLTELFTVISCFFLCSSLMISSLVNV